MRGTTKWILGHTNTIIEKVFKKLNRTEINLDGEIYDSFELFRRCTGNNDKCGITIMYDPTTARRIPNNRLSTDQFTHESSYFLHENVYNLCYLFFTNVHSSFIRSKIYFCSFFFSPSHRDQRTLIYFLSYSFYYEYNSLYLKSRQQ